MNIKDDDNIKHVQNRCWAAWSAKNQA